MQTQADLIRKEYDTLREHHTQHEAIDILISALVSTKDISDITALSIIEKALDDTCSSFSIADS